jgi:hypothetical protein
MTPSEIEPATFSLVAQCLSQLRHCVPHIKIVLKERRHENVDWGNMAQGRDFCEHSNESPGYTQGGKFLESLSDYNFSKELFFLKMFGWLVV